MTARTLRQWAGLKPPESLDFATTAVILIDFQEEYFDSRTLLVEDAMRAAENARTLVQFADRTGMKVIHIKHVAASPKSALFAPGSPNTEIIPLLQPAQGHVVIEKPLPSSFVRTRLDSVLREAGIEMVILAGFATHMCVDSTARDAVSLGYRVIVADDACGSRDLPGGGRRRGPGAPAARDRARRAGGPLLRRHETGCHCAAGRLLRAGGAGGRRGLTAARPAGWRRAEIIGVNAAAHYTRFDRFNDEEKRCANAGSTPS